MTATPEYDERFITLEEAERLAHQTGEYDGREVAFSNDGENWSESWLPTEENPVPRLARVAVHRSSMKLPTVVVVSWSEYYPEGDPERAATWDKLKTVLLAKVGVVSALRSAFRDVIGNRHEPHELDQASIAPAVIPPAWLEEAERTVSHDGLVALRSSAIAGKFMSDEVTRVLLRRSADISTASDAAADSPKPKPPTAPRPARKRTRKSSGVTA